VTATRQPAAFEAVILHELAHIRNKDVNQTYLAIAIWRAFVLAALLPLAGLLTLSHVPISAPRVLWRVAVSALTVYLLRNSVLRSREFGADARVREFDPDTSLGAVLSACRRAADGVYGILAGHTRRVRRERRLWWTPSRCIGAASGTAWRSDWSPPSELPRHRILSTFLSLTALTEV
jgi:Peptidase family M48